MRADLAVRDLRRAVSRHRVLLAAGLAAGSVAAGVSAVAPAAPASRSVLAAATDLDSGARLSADDVVVVRLPVDLVPSGALTDPGGVVGRLVAGPVRAGEALTDVRLLGPALLPRGTQVAVPVRVAEPATAALVSAGDVVDVLSAAPDGSSATTVVRAVRVLAVPVADVDPAEGTLLVVAAHRSDAAGLASAAVRGQLSVLLHGQ